MMENWRVKKIGYVRSIGNYGVVMKIRLVSVRRGWR